MQNLNLYNYYDKSLADINKNYLEIASSRKTVNKKSGHGKTVAASLLLFIIILMSGGYYGYEKYINVQPERPKYAKPQGPDLRSTEEKLGYVKVQIFEFADETANAENEEVVIEEKYESTLASKIREFSKSETLKNEKRPTAYDEKKKIVDSVDKTQTGKKTDAIPQTPKTNKVAGTAAPIKNVTASTATPAKANTPVTKAKTYAVVFEDINKDEYDFLKKAGPLFKMNSELLEEKPKMATVWRLYRMHDKGGILIGGKNADFLQDFNDKEEAIKFAKNNDIQAIIRPEQVNIGTYSVRFCCSSIENSKKFAENSNIGNKTIKIIREE